MTAFTQWAHKLNYAIKTSMWKTISWWKVMIHTIWACFFWGEKNMQICDVSFTSQQNPFGYSIYWQLWALGGWATFGVTLSFVQLGGVPSYGIDTGRMLTFVCAENMDEDKITESSSWPGHFQCISQRCLCLLLVFSPLPNALCQDLGFQALTYIHTTGLHFCPLCPSEPVFLLL